MTVIIEILLIVMAAVSNAIMDTCADHYYVSVFNGWNPVFWDKATAAKFEKYLWFTKYKTDAWHLFKTIMLTCFAILPIIHKAIMPWWAEFMLAVVIWVLTFNVFFNKILRK